LSVGQTVGSEEIFTIGTPQIKIEEEELIAMIWLGFSS
jgi:hypothetical protein